MQFTPEHKYGAVTGQANGVVPVKQSTRESGQMGTVSVVGVQLLQAWAKLTHPARASKQQETATLSQRTQAPGPAKVS